MFKLSPIISNGVVFQRNAEIRVPGEGKGLVRAELLGEKAEVEANGNFVIRFSPHTAGGPYEMKISDDDTTVIIKNIMIGEVIIVAGQSNAELTVAETYDRISHFEPNDGIRYYLVTRPMTDKKYNIIPDDGEMCEKWNGLRTENAMAWSAIGLHTAIHFYDKLGIPVGIIGLFKGGSVIDAFMSEKALEGFDIDYAKTMIDHYYPAYPWNKPSTLYHYMIKKVIPFSAGSVIWYQGESNRSLYEGEFYDKMLLRMVDEWREVFENDKLPFAIIQINIYPEECEKGVIAIREAQIRAVGKMKYAELVRIDDMGEHEKIHPENKKGVALRACDALSRLCNI